MFKTFVIKKGIKFLHLRTLCDIYSIVDLDCLKSTFAECLLELLFLQV